MGKASAWMLVRHTLGRALRETGQALDRLGIMGAQHAVTTRQVGDDPYIFDDHLSRHRHQFPLVKRGAPIVSKDAAFLAPCSTLIGSVRVGPGASIWYKAILRADGCENGSSFKNLEDDSVWFLDPDRERLNSSPYKFTGGGIFIGENSNVQDNCVITSRVDHSVIGKGVTIGHSAQIHSATVKDYSLIGMGSILREGVVVETEAFIAAGAVVAPGTTVASGELWVGQPARKLRDLTPQERSKLHFQSDEYVKVATGQKSVGELGGNVPETLIKYLMMGANHGDKEAESDEIPEKIGQQRN